MKIVIVGGGTAGWLAAFMINKTQPNHDISVIESSALGIIGAGEGSTGSLTNIIKNQDWDFGLDEEDFLRQTKATIKLGILHKDWKQLNHEYIAPIDAPADAYSHIFGTSTSLFNLISKGEPQHLASYNGYNIEYNSSSFYFENSKLSNLGNHAYHFDGHLVGKFFKSKCDNVKSIDAIVTNVNINEFGEIFSLNLDNGSVVEGDFFIDASGFKRVLLNALGVGWVSYKKYLPVDTAIPFLINYKENEKISPITTAWAQKNGWMWKIPTQDRYGCGYVFSSEFTDVDSAKNEIELKLGHEISPIKIINFEAGRSEKVWVKNCLSIGLASAFLEPLEATSIHSTVVQLFSFVFNHLRDTKEETCNLGAINTYNNISSIMYDGFKDFISIHYASNRTDSVFWKTFSNIDMRTDKAKDIIKIASYRALNEGDFFKSTGFEGSVLHNWVLAGLGIITKETARKELSFYGQNEYAENLHKDFTVKMDRVRPRYIENTHLIKMLLENSL